MKVAKAATRPTTTLDDATERAPLLTGVVEAAAEVEAALEGEFAAAAAGVVDAEDPVDEAGEALERAAERSWGIISGLLPAAPRLTDPSFWRTSELAARKLRVYRTFSAMNSWDHSGRPPMSMLEPQVAARALPVVAFATIAE
jgi:hypothetical protein